MAIRESLQHEWHTQWPLVRFEIYKWGSIAVGGGLVTLAAKLLLSLKRVPEIYFYGALFCISCVLFYFMVARLRFTQFHKEHKQGSEDKFRTVSKMSLAQQETMVKEMTPVPTPAELREKTWAMVGDLARLLIENDQP